MVRRRNTGRRGSPLYMTPALELLPNSYDYVRAHLRLFLLLYLFPLIIGLSNGYWVVDTHRHLVPDSFDAANAVGNATLPAYAYGHLDLYLIPALVIATVLRIMLHAAELRAVNGGSLKLKSLWRVVRSRGVEMAKLYFFISVLCFIWLLPAVHYRHIWFEILCFIPAAYMLRRYFVAPYVLLEDPESTAFSAMSRSAALTRKDSWSVYVMIGALLLFALFGIIWLIGWILAFILVLFYSCAPVIRYNELKRLG